MRRLILLRHAKSDRPAGVVDLDRPLNPRGRRSAPLMAAYMAEAGLRPDHALVSPAARTRETWALVRERLGDVPATEVRSIYEAPASALLAAVRAGPEAAQSLIVIGHNPGLQDLAVKLLPARARGRVEVHFPTAALAVIDLPVERWEDAAWGIGHLDRFVVPRELGAEAGPD